MITIKYGVGIDVSKGKSTISIISIEGEIIQEPFDILHTKEDLYNLLHILNKFPINNVKIVMEATGNYHLPILNFLSDFNYFVIVENALKIKKFKDIDLRRVKTDKKDSLKIAEYACCNWHKFQKKYESDSIYDNLRFLSRQYLSHIQLLVKLKLSFSNLCDLLFPGYYQLLNDKNFLLGLETFKNYYHPSIVLNLDYNLFTSEINSLAKKLGHKTMGITLSSQIYDLAHSTISSRPNNIYSQLSVNNCVDALILEIKTTNSIITEMNNLAISLPEYNIVSNFPGCGKKLTPLIIAEIGDIRRFRNAGSLIAYAGIDSPPFQSGQYNINKRISKKGNKYLRQIGYEIMLSIKATSKKNNIFYDFIVKKENEGKLKSAAKIAGLNKFLRIYYGTVKSKYKDLNIWF